MLSGFLHKIKGLVWLLGLKLRNPQAGRSFVWTQWAKAKCLCRHGVSGGVRGELGGCICLAPGTDALEERVMICPKAEPKVRIWVMAIYLFGNGSLEAW